jgi:DNA mismatch endonuclease (patch repair protein)
VPGLACEADVVFPSEKLAVFLDGCFWHSCPVHATRPHSNADFWARKLDRTRDRDRANDRALSAAGWQVQRVWEHVSVDSEVRSIQERLTEIRLANNHGATGRPQREEDGMGIPAS